MPSYTLPGGTIKFEETKTNGRHVAVAASGGGGSGSWVEGTEPSISSVSGTFTQGETLTISGSNFSAVSGSVYKYDNFDDGTAETAVTGYTQNGGGNDAFYDSTVSSLSGSQCLRFDQTSGSNTGFPAVLEEINTTEAFFSYWFQFQNTDSSQSSSPQIKLSPLWADSTHTSAPRVSHFITFADGTNNIENHLASQVGVSGVDVSAAEVEQKYDYFYSGLPPEDTWFRIDGYVKLDQTTGKRFFKTSYNQEFTKSSQFPDGHFASLNGTVPATDWDGEEMETMDPSADGSNFQYFAFPFFAQSGQDIRWFVDCLYLNKTPEAVVIATGSTWDNRGQSTMMFQNVTTRTNSDITIECEEGALPSTGALYAYVINRDLMVNSSGYQVRSA